MRLINRKWGIGFFAAVLLFPLIGMSSSASAAVWTNRAIFHGYFTNSTGAGICEFAGCAHQGYVLPAPLGGDSVPASVNSVDSLITFLQNYNKDGNTRDVRASGFIVQTMLGRSGDEANANGGPNISDADWNDVRARMNAVDINWNANYSTPDNTYMQAAPSLDVALDNAGQSGPAILFTEKGTGKILYAIFRECANPDGSLPGLSSVPPPPPPPATFVNCGSLVDVSPDPTEAGDSVTVKVTVNWSGNASGSGTNPSLSVIGAGGGGVKSISSSSTGSGGTFTLTSNPFTVPTAKRYAVQWALTINGVPSGNCGGNISAGSSSAFNAYDFPYLNVTGGDAIAGARFSTDVGTPCGASDTNAGIATWNKGATLGFKGAGSQYGAITFSYIQDFITNKGNPGVGNGDSLSFANEDVPPASPDSDNPASGRYGGFFKQGPCIDYWGQKPTTGLQNLGAAVNVNNASLNNLNGEYTYTGNLTIGPSNIGNGKRATIYVDGDVNIRGDIKYGAGNPSWGTTSDIPMLQLIVKGVIYIDDSVSQLDGTYVAVPDAGYDKAPSGTNTYANPIKGTISTCSNGFSVRSPAVDPAGLPAMISACNNQLVVNGTFAADQIFFLRTFGTMNGQPAEQFNFSPEVWLAPSGTGTIDPTYKSIVGLPPVL
jgi:hypothetical protein